VRDKLIDGAGAAPWRTVKVLLTLSDVNVTVAVRELRTELAATDTTATSPDRPDGVTATQFSLAVAVHDDGSAVTSMSREAGAYVGSHVVRDKLTDGGGAPDCVTVRVRVPLVLETDTTPVRDTPRTRFSATVTVTFWPDWPDGVTVSQFESDVAVHVDGLDVTRIVVDWSRCVGAHVVFAKESDGGGALSCSTSTTRLRVPDTTVTTARRSCSTTFCATVIVMVAPE
jgi:hypothetical protein